MLSLHFWCFYCSEGIWSAYLYLVCCQDLWKITGNIFLQTTVRSFGHVDILCALLRWFFALVCDWFKIKVCIVKPLMKILFWYWVWGFSYLHRKVDCLCKFHLLKVSRGGQTVTLVGTTLVLFGGEDAKRCLLNDLHILDLETMTWDDVDAM
jgi:hypothetical protein